MATAKVIRKLPKVQGLTKEVRDDRFTKDGNMNEVPKTYINLVDRGKLRKNRKAAMREKAQRDREEIFSLYRQGVPRFEIAEMVGVDVATVKGVISRGFADGDLTEYVIADDEQEIINLRKSGMTYREIAKKLGRTEGSISGTLNRLRREGVL